MRALRVCVRMRAFACTDRRMLLPAATIVQAKDVMAAIKKICH